MCAFFQVEAVDLIARGKAPRIMQPQEGASYDLHLTAKPQFAQLDWNLTQQQMHNFIRGNDKVLFVNLLYLSGRKILSEIM